MHPPEQEAHRRRTGALRVLRSLLLIALLACGPALRAAQAQGEAPIVVTPGEAPAFHAAVQLFQDEALPALPDRAAELRRMVGEGMRYSSVLLPLADEAFLGPMETTDFGGDKRAVCADFTQGGADALVEGRIQNAGQRLRVDYQIWDTVRCVKLREGRLDRPARDLTRLAKLLADAVVAGFTGTPGVAGTEIAFISNRSGQREVWVMDADGGRQRKATSGESIKAFPDWTHDGLAILYTSYKTDAMPGLYLSSRGRYRAGPILTTVLQGLPKYRGVFSPTGDELIMVTSFEGAAELFRVSRNGRGLHRMTRSEAIDISPAWSPDGKRVAFVSDRSGAPQVYVMNRDGGELRRLTYNGSYNTAPSWSPDGRWIAYETRVEGQFDIWLIDPEGVSNFPLVTHRRSDESPSWSADSRKLAFSSTRRGRADVYVVDLNGENLRRLTSGAGENLQPVFGPYAQ